MQHNETRERGCPGVPQRKLPGEPPLAWSLIVGKAGRLVQLGDGYAGTASVFMSASSSMYCEAA